MQVVYEDEHLLVVDKPAGLPTQAGRDSEAGLYEQLREREPTLALHHRLDRPASGLVVFGRSAVANKALTDGFREHTIRRTYRAVLVGTPSETVWDRSLDGRRARSEVEVLSSDSGFTAVALRLHTGRTHQLRRHAALYGTPLAGDRRYGGHAARAWSRLALHAHELAFAHPVSGEAVVLTSALPDDLAPLWTLTGA